MVTISYQVVVFAVAFMAASVDAHSKMSLPKPTWIYEDGTNSPAGTIDSSNVLPVPDGMGYEGDPLSNTEAYWTAFNASKYTSLKELVWKNEVVNTDSLYGTATIECGYSWTNGTARDLPDEVQWDKLTTGHDGPCEIWCDDTLVFSDQNCAVNYPDSPASFPYDKAACEGKSMLTAIWLALHSPPWQVFTNCAPLKGATYPNQYVHLNDDGCAKYHDVDLVDRRDQCSDSIYQYGYLYDDRDRSPCGRNIDSLVE
ncbi:Hypothetical protein PHPALM_6115 [Phytophthora palmivora]|uniref:Uncharacterized protein n=1 Tax=Phytophthora palmivora TaxID=4796 RepID=A0A2P4YG03_9STRA|nr:Hypothetical protein PHPALM_6115 [Phytophthora palmivora]